MLKDVVKVEPRGRYRIWLQFQDGGRMKRAGTRWCSIRCSSSFTVSTWRETAQITPSALSRSRSPAPSVSHSL